MSLIHSTDPDFKVCRLDFETLAELQRQAEERGWGTRWTSADALRSQVNDDVVLLQSFMREERGGGLRTYRCLVLFAAVDGDVAGGVTTIDVAPETYAGLPQIDQHPDVRAVFARVFALATGGIAMVRKD
jgi:hypothetical protein